MKIFLATMLMVAAFAHSKEVSHQLTIGYTQVNYSGETRQAMAINNSIPGPILTFTEGDVAIIDVINNTDDEASIHWHGLLLPQEQDGVPYITMFPIKAGETFQYRFPLNHAGTYWYHSHTKIDEQRGQYGAIVVHPKQGYQENFQHDVVVQLSDWTDEAPYDVLKNLKKDGDWYAYQKDSVISLQGYLEHSDLSTWLTNRWQRMEGMDLSDVGYDAFLANGATQLALLPTVKPGDKVRVRLINSAASSIFKIQQSAAPFTIIAADGVDVAPVKVNKFQINMAETYDFIISIPRSGAFEFAANNIDGTGGVKVTLGAGKAQPSPDPIKPNLYTPMMHSEHGNLHASEQALDHQNINNQQNTSDAHSTHNSHSMNNNHQMTTQMEASSSAVVNQPMAAAPHHGMHGNMQDEMPDNMPNNMPLKMDHAMVHEASSAPKHKPKHEPKHKLAAPPSYDMLSYNMLKLRSPVQYQGDIQTFRLTLTGNMDSYNWSFNNTPLSKADVIKIDRGKVIRFNFVNQSMMNHPMHLHGHFFKVISGNGDYDVLKHTVNVPPMGNVTIEFAANEQKDWFFHCHNLYHTKTGMARVVRYSDYNGNKAFMDAKANSNDIMDDDWYSRSDVQLFNHHAAAKFRYSNAQYLLEVAVERHFEEQASEYQANYHVIQSPWLSYYLEIARNESEEAGKKEHKNEVKLGVNYTLPFNIDTATWLNDSGEVHFEAETEFQLTTHFSVAMSASTESEWAFLVEYRQSPQWSIALNANDESGLGFGVTATF